MKNVIILEKAPTTIAEVHSVLKARKDDERNYEQKLVWEHVSKFKKLGVRDSKKLVEELSGLELRRLKEEHIVQIVDLLPKTLKELKSVFSDSKSNLHDDELKKVMDAVKKYVN
jgi:DNA-directed RNA polymerase subunit F